MDLRVLIFACFDCTEYEERLAGTFGYTNVEGATQLAKPSCLQISCRVPDYKPPSSGQYASTSREDQILHMHNGRRTSVWARMLRRVQPTAKHNLT